MTEYEKLIEKQESEKKAFLEKMVAENKGKRYKGFTLTTQKKGGKHYFVAVQSVSNTKHLFHVGLSPETFEKKVDEWLEKNPTVLSELETLERL